MLARPFWGRVPAPLKRWSSNSTAAQVKSINSVQQLYYTHPTSPGSVFFLPRGTAIFSKLVAFVRLQMLGQGFSEVVTPQMYRRGLWETSGHWQHYHEDMFGITAGASEHGAGLEDEFSLKPMNCPGHCVLFKSRERSFRDLPVRYADFSPLHRNEASGALTGLTRVRRFHQDDGHIFCRPDQVSDEIARCLRLVDTCYRVFGLSYEMLLSTRPDSYAGELSIWENAESDLTAALESWGKPYTVNAGDGAFYGPKIDFVVQDNLGNRHQAATIQLDFQLPRQFGLEYDAQGGGMGTPVMIHRAVLGSLERFMALLIDHYSGRWPFWLNPTQAVVVPVSDAHAVYAHQVAQQLRNLPQTGAGDSAGQPLPLTTVTFDVDVYDQAEPLGGRLRRARKLGTNYIVVVGGREVEKGTISVTERGSRGSSECSVADLQATFNQRLEAYT